MVEHLHQDCPSVCNFWNLFREVSQNRDSSQLSHLGIFFFLCVFWQISDDKMKLTLYESPVLGDLNRYNIFFLLCSVGRSFFASSLTHVGVKDWGSNVSQHQQYQEAGGSFQIQSLHYVTVFSALVGKRCKRRLALGNESKWKQTIACS